MSLIDEIKIKSLSEAQEILKAAGSEDIFDFEKAHKDGDLHPNGKWVWVSSAAGGKGDWRTLNGRTHQKHMAAQGGNDIYRVKKTETYSHDINGVSVNVSKNKDGSYTLEANGKKVKSDDPSFFKDKLTPRVKKALAKEVGIESTTAKKTSTKKTTSGNSLKSKLDDIKRAISKNGYTANVSTDGSIVIYEKGARKTTENIKGRIKSFDDIDWGNKKGVQAKLESAIKAALEVGIDVKNPAKSFDIKQIGDFISSIKTTHGDVSFIPKNGAIYLGKRRDYIGDCDEEEKTIELRQDALSNVKRDREAIKEIASALKEKFGFVSKTIYEENPRHGLKKAYMKIVLKPSESEKVNSIHIVDMQQSVRDKNSLLKQLKSSKSNKVLIHYHSTSGFDINKMRSIAEKEGWKITDKSVDKNGNHTYNVNSYIMFEKQTKK